MRISSINRQSFGAKPDSATKFLLVQLEQKSIDTKPVTDIMKRIYVGDTVTTKFLSSGDIRMDIYSKNGDQVSSLIKGHDKCCVSTETYALKDPELFYRKLYIALKAAGEKRLSNQRNYDKINSAFGEC